MSRFLMILAILAAFVIDANAQKNGDIRQVDFKNFTYEPFCAGEDSQKIKVEDGEFTEEKEVDGYTDRLYFSASVEAYGDVDGDGRDEAIISSVCNTGGTGNFTEGFVYTMRGGRAVLMTRIEGGDRAYGGIREITVEKGVLTVDRNDPGEMGGACCPEAAVKIKYKWNGSELVEFGQPETRQLYPARRIAFARGKSSGTAVARIPAGEFQRFVVGAAKGQVMIVRVKPENATVNLRFGDAETTEDAGFLRAVLQEKGDYTFEVWNPGEADGDFTVTVEIK